MDVKKLISSRRGIAIELAIGAMFLTVAISIILFTVATHQTKLIKSTKDDLAEKVELTQVGDAAISWYKELENKAVDATADGEVYDYSFNHTDNTILISDNDGTPVLTITLVENNGITTIQSYK